MPVGGGRLPARSRLMCRLVRGSGTRPPLTTPRAGSPRASNRAEHWRPTGPAAGRCAVHGPRGPGGVVRPGRGRRWPWFVDLRPDVSFPQAASSVRALCHALVRARCLRCVLGPGRALRGREGRPAQEATGWCSGRCPQPRSGRPVGSCPSCACVRGPAHRALRGSVAVGRQPWTAGRPAYPGDRNGHENAGGQGVLSAESASGAVLQVQFARRRRRPWHRSASAARCHGAVQPCLTGFAACHIDVSCPPEMPPYLRADGRHGRRCARAPVAPVAPASVGPGRCGPRWWTPRRVAGPDGGAHVVGPLVARPGVAGVRAAGRVRSGAPGWRWR